VANTLDPRMDRGVRKSLSPWEDRLDRLVSSALRHRQTSIDYTAIMRPLNIVPPLSPTPRTCPGLPATTTDVEVADGAIDYVTNDATTGRKLMTLIITCDRR